MTFSLGIKFGHLVKWDSSKKKKKKKGNQDDQGLWVNAKYSLTFGVYKAHCI